MGNRLQGVLVGLIVGAIVASGAAYAWTVFPPNSTDKYYACVSKEGVVQSGTLRLNVEPTKCARATDMIRSWNAQGPQGAQGIPGVQGETGTAGEPGAKGDPGPATSALFRAQKSTTQIYGAGPLLADGPYPAVFVRVNFDIEEFDTSLAYDPTKSQYTVPSDGYYSFEGSVLASTSGPGSCELILAVNGHIYSRLDKVNTQAGDWATIGGTSVQHLTAGDTVELWLYSSAPGTAVQSDTPTYGYRNQVFSGYRLAT